MNSPFDDLVKHATQPVEQPVPAPDKRPGRTFKLLELISQHPGISTEALSKQSGVCSQQIWTRLQRHLARGQVFHEAGGWRMSPDAPQLREVHQAIALLKRHGFSVQEPAPHVDLALFKGQRADFIVVDDDARHPETKPVRNNPVSALAIRILVDSGCVTQSDADLAFTAACNAMEDEAKRMNVELPWVVRKAELMRVPEDVWLLAAGEDGKHSRLVVGWAALEKAWLDVHYFGVDHDNLDDQQRGTLAVLNDSDEWCHDQDGNRFSLHISYEGDWVSVTSVTDPSAILTAAQAAPQDPVPGPDERITPRPAPHKRPPPMAAQAKGGAA